MNAKEIFEKVQENEKKLDDCTIHDFSIPMEPGKLVRRWKCSRCEGEVDVLAKRWYERGLEDMRTWD